MPAEINPNELKLTVELSEEDGSQARHSRFRFIPTPLFYYLSDSFLPTVVKKGDRCK